jgi:hypothetical protein
MGGISGVTEGAKFPTRFEVAMNATAEAAKIRERGASVYVYVKPMYVAEKKSNKSGKSDIVHGRVQLPTDNFCDGYRIVLSPANNYSLSQDFDFKMVMRRKNSTPFTSQDTEITQIEVDAFVVRSAMKPFDVDSGSRMYDPCTHPGSKGMWR